MAPTFRELLSEVKKEIREVSHEHVRQLLDSGAKVKLVDVREADEYAGGRLPGAVHIPRGYLELRIEEQAARDEELVLYCAGGTRSALAARTLRQMGYTRVSSLAGGYNRWSDAALPVERPVVLSAEQKERYRRHLILPEVGEEGQAKLLKSRVLLLGAGGLGSPAALYLAAAGVGTLGVVDADVVDLSNLQRQVLHTLERRGQPKVQSAKAAIEALNPDVRVVPFQERLTTANVERILADFDLVLDGGDNFPTRYLLNDACVLLGKPNVHGSVFRFEGQVTTFLPGHGPCYRCLYPTPPRDRSPARSRKDSAPSRRTLRRMGTRGESRRSSPVLVSWFSFCSDIAVVSLPLPRSYPTRVALHRRPGSRLAASYAGPSAPLLLKMHPVGAQPPVEQNCS